MRFKKKIKMIYIMVIVIQTKHKHVPVCGSVTTIFPFAGPTSFKCVRRSLHLEDNARKGSHLPDIVSPSNHGSKLSSSSGVSVLGFQLRYNPVSDIMRQLTSSNDAQFISRNTRETVKVGASVEIVRRLDSST